MLKITLLLLSLFPLAGYSATSFLREYNIWYAKDGVMYDVTQTSDSRPVLISISQPGTSQANLVISWLIDGECLAPHNNAALKIDGKPAAASYLCLPSNKGKIEHFTVIDAEQVNNMVTRLQSQFTVLLQDDIKVWASNFATPKFGVGPQL